MTHRTPKTWASARLRAMPVSMFHTMDVAKQQAKAQGHPIIDLSIGSSDLSPPKAALAALESAVYDPTTYGYCLFSCTEALREAISQWFLAHLGLTVRSQDEIYPLIGSQEGLAHALLALTDPGDVVLAPDPAYPSYYGAMALAGVQPHMMPLLAENGFVPDLSLVPNEVAAQAKVMILSYPNNPTAATLSPKAMQAIIDYCAKHTILLIHDFPYVDMTYGDYRAPSALEAVGGMTYALEIYSCSKSYHMGGFRIGWAAGNADAVQALGQAKSAIDFNAYLGIQRAAIAALATDISEVRASAKVFERRRDAMISAFQEIGWEVPIPKASMYIWAPLPEGLPQSFEFAVELAKATGVCVAPGRGFGLQGEGFVRLALVRDEAVLKRAITQIGQFLTTASSR